MYTYKNKGKIFTISIIASLILIITGILVLSYRIISGSNFSSTNINNVLGQVTENKNSLLEKKNDAIVIEVIDGDTIKVIQDGEKKTVRLIGIDAPEVKEKECMYQESTNYLSKLILNKTVTLQADSTQSNTDRYNRELRYIFIGGLNINRKMIQQGMAKEYTYNKPYLYQEDFVESQERARIIGDGIWSNSCNGK